MKDFMLIFQGPDYEKIGLSPEEVQLQMEKWFAWVAKLQAANLYKGGEALHPHGKIVTSPNVVSDGPFAEAKELVGGYFIVTAQDYEQAIQIANDFPDFKYDGKVQVREVVDFSQV